MTGHILHDTVEAGKLNVSKVPLYAMNCVCRPTVFPNRSVSNKMVSRFINPEQISPRTHQFTYWWQDNYVTPFRVWVLLVACPGDRTIKWRTAETQHTNPTAMCINKRDLLWSFSNHQPSSERTKENTASQVCGSLYCTWLYKQWVTAINKGTKCTLLSSNLENVLSA